MGSSPSSQTGGPPRRHVSPSPSEQQPKPQDLPSLQGCSSLLTQEHITYLVKYMERSLRQRWSLLYDSRANGLSFSQFMAACIDKGPTLVVVKAKDGSVFGGITDSSWEKPQAQFYGTARCMVFSIEPKLQVYTTEGVNNNYMYLNFGAETYPNGVGMGGQHNWFAWYIDDHFEKGHSQGPNSTFGSPSLTQVSFVSSHLFKTVCVGIRV